PVRVPLDGLPAKKLRWIVEEPYALFGIGYLAVSEVFLLSGNENVAPSGSLGWSDSFLPDRSMVPAFLKDEKTPLGLPLLRTETSLLGYHSEIKDATGVDEEWIELSWAEPQEVSSIRLIPAQQRVLPHTETFAFPLAHRTDFLRGGEKVGSRSVRYAIDPGQNVVTVAGFEGEKVDRIRWTATELWQRRNTRFLALAEVEVYGADDQNIAGTAELALSSSGVESKIWNREALTDGLASEGELLTFGEWLQGLDHSRNLRKERRKATAQLAATIEKTNKDLFTACIVALAAVLLAVVIWWRRQKHRAEKVSSEFRRQLAADLHDDLGGNLGSIVLLAEQARSNGELNEETGEDLTRVVELARESRHQLRGILEVGDDSRNEPMDRDAFTNRLRQIVHDFFGEEHGYLTIPDDEGESISQLTEKQRRGLLFFCKEALHNLAQHSDASRVLVQLEPSGEGLCLRIEDNSSTPLSKDGALISRSLDRRAQQLEGRCKVETLDGGVGNSLALEIPGTAVT
ncbi:MAG: histidine kinase, partial [Verrucomicrobiota bacterium]